MKQPKWNMYNPRENAPIALDELDDAVRGEVKWMALAFVLRVIVCFLIESVGYSQIPVVKGTDGKHPEER